MPRPAGRDPPPAGGSASSPAAHLAPRKRRTFSHLERSPARAVLDVPNLIDIQRRSFEEFLDKGIRETIADISPIEDYTGTLAVEFGEHEFDAPPISQQECRETDKTYEAALSMRVRFVNKGTGEIREQRVFMGNFPLMTEAGTFIINGTERVVVTQLVRSPGAYIMEPKDPTKQVFTANLMPSRGSWLELEIDKKGQVFVRIDRKRKLPVTTLLRALPQEDLATGEALASATDEEILALFTDPETKEPNPFIRMTLEKDVQKTPEQALVEVFKKQRPGEPPTLENSKALLRSLFFDPKRYDLTRVGRYKLNSRLELEVDPDIRVLTNRDLIELIRRLVSLPIKLGADIESRDLAEESRHIPRNEAVLRELDEYEHFGNRRLRTVGELVQEAFRVGLYRMERVVRERMTTEDVDTITPQTIINIRPVVAALKEFFGSSQLSQFMDQTNSLSGLTHRRRLSALGAGGLTRERAPIEVRDVHPTHYGRMCPIETPEGPNIGLIGSLASFATVSEHGFVQSPYRRVGGGKPTDEVRYLDASEEARFVIAQANAPVDKGGKLIGPVLVRKKGGGGEPDQVEPEDVDFMDVSPAQIVSVATALIPFLEHDDANRALMGSNMMRQAVPLLITEAPAVGTGLEYRAAVDTGDVKLAERAGSVVYADANAVVVRTDDGQEDRYELVKFMRVEPGHADPPEADRAGGRQGRGRLRAGRRLVDRRGRARARQEPALRLHVVGRLQLRGRDHPLGAPGQGRRPVVRAHPRVRGGRAGHEARRRGDHAGHPEPLRGVAARPRRPRHRPHRRRGRLGRPARRQGDAEGRDRADRRGEADPRDLQGEGARGPRHLAEGAPRRGRQGHRRQDLPPRGGRRAERRRQRAGARLRRQEAQDRGGRQARRPARQQGRDLEDRARGGHAVPGRRQARRRHPQPPRRAEPHEHRPGAGDAPRLRGPLPAGRRRAAGGVDRHAGVRRRHGARGRRRAASLAGRAPLVARSASSATTRTTAAPSPARSSSTTAATATRSTRRSPSATCTS